MQSLFLDVSVRFESVYFIARSLESFTGWETGMRFPTPKIDMWVLSASIALLGASQVIGADPTHHLEKTAFWGGVAGFVLLAIWHALSWLSNRIQSLKAEELVKVDNRGGAYVGGDNTGTQQVFHGPVTFNKEPARPKYPDREFVPPTLTVDRLLAHFDNKTDIQAQALCKPFYGKWMRVSGEVFSVSEFSSNLFSMSIHLQSISCYFDRKWETSLHALSKGDRITVVGILYSAAIFSVALTDCEIEDSE